MNFTIVSDIPAHAQAIIYAFSIPQWESFISKHPEGIAGINAQTLKGVFTAEAKSSFTCFDLNGNGRQIHFIGLGSKPDFAGCLKHSRSFFYQKRSTLPTQIAIDLATTGLEHQPDQIEGLVNGIQLSTYQISLYKSRKEKNTSFSQEEKKIVLVASQNNTEIKFVTERGQEMAMTQMGIFDLVNAPANKKTPTIIGAWAKASAVKYGFQARVLNRADLEVEGLSALLAVSQGNTESPILLLLEYHGDPGNQAFQFGLVGKGVTFDTGGISIKGSANLHYMKSDMGGAAAVLGAFEMIAKTGLRLNCAAVIPLTENAISGTAVKPGDVIGSYLGKTIEVIDTDAEGRLILADGLSYLIKNYQPKTILDAATLTGSCIQTLGYQAGGMFTNNETLAARLYDTGMSCGERVWRLPLWDAYSDDIQSDIADLKNYSGKPVAGAISAAKFLEEFTENHPAWVHLDIAGVAFCDSEFSTMRSATGYGIRLIFNLINSSV